MGYADNKAAGRRTPGDHAGTKPAPAPAAVSAQEKTQGQTAKFRTYDTAKPTSNQIRFDTAGKGLGVAGRPSSQAASGRDKSFPAVDNPSK
jgi:hypothetical protein